MPDPSSRYSLRTLDGVVERSDDPCDMTKALRRMGDDVPASVWRDADSAMLAANPAWERRFGWERKSRPVPPSRAAAGAPVAAE